MTRAHMPGRVVPLHVVQPPPCSFAESLTQAERAMLAELGALDAPPQLHLVPTSTPPRPTPAADLRRARRRELLEGLVMWSVLLSSIVFAAVAAMSHFAEIAP